MKHPDAIILGIDPSLTATGVVLLRTGDEGIVLLDAAVFTLSSAKDLSVYWIADQVFQVIQQMITQAGVDVTHWGMETPIFGPCAKTLIRQSCMVGSIATKVHDKYGVYPWEVNPAQTKASLGLRGTARKAEVVERVRQMVPTFDERYKKDRKVVIEAIADAIGVAQAVKVLR